MRATISFLSSRRGWAAAVVLALAAFWLNCISAVAQDNSVVLRVGCAPDGCPLPVMPGSVVTLEVSVEQVEHLHAYDLTITYPPDRFEIVGTPEVSTLFPVSTSWILPPEPEYRTGGSMEVVYTRMGDTHPTYSNPGQGVLFTFQGLVKELDQPIVIGLTNNMMISAVMDENVVPPQEFYAEIVPVEVHGWVLQQNKTNFPFVIYRP